MMLGDARRRMVVDARGWAVFLPGQEIRCPVHVEQEQGAYCAHLVCSRSSVTVFIRPMCPADMLVEAPTAGRIRLENVRCACRGGGRRYGHLLVLELDPARTSPSPGAAHG